MPAVTLLSRTYEIKCPDSETELLQEASQKLNDLLNKNKKEFPHLTEFQLMLLGALTCSHELLKHEKRVEIEREKFAEFVGLLERNRS